MEARDTVRDIFRGGKDGQKGPGEGGAATDGPRAAAGSRAAGGGGGRAARGPRGGGGGEGGGGGGAPPRRQRTLIWSGVGAVIAVGVFALLAWSGGLGQQAATVMGRKVEAPPGERVREVGNPHIPVGTKGTGYTRNPPTSGEHYGSEAKWDVYTQPVPDELVIHNLEHGGIWISYKDPNDTGLASKLAPGGT